MTDRVCIKANAAITVDCWRSMSGEQLARVDVSLWIDVTVSAELTLQFREAEGANAVREWDLTASPSPENANFAHITLELLNEASP